MVRRLVVVVIAIAFVACGWDWTVVPKPAAASDGGTEGGISQDGTCASNDECRSDEHCRFSDGRCGAGGRGSCVFSPVQKECDVPEEPPYVACGCDGKTAPNACSVEATRMDLAIEAACPAPADTFRCGWHFCPKSTFCYRSVSPKGDFFSCGLWPCAGQSCAACNNPVPKCATATCSTDGAGVTTVVCTEQ